MTGNCHKQIQLIYGDVIRELGSILEDFMKSLRRDTYGTHIVLSEKEYLLDVKEKIDEIISHRYPPASPKRGAK